MKDRYNVGNWCLKHVHSIINCKHAEKTGVNNEQKEEEKKMLLKVGNENNIANNHVIH